jgi:uncharacterized protein YaiE (UPF0345 family)
MIAVNEYFDGRVKSLGFDLEGIEHTVGVISPGEYTFGTEKEEHITIVAGGLEIRTPEADWRRVQTGDTVVVAGRSEFDLKVAGPTAYVCVYR